MASRAKNQGALARSVVDVVSGPKEQDSDAEDETRAKVVEEDDDEDDDDVWKLDFEAGERSDLRVANAPNLAELDSRYKGKKVERKALVVDDEGDELTQDERDHASAELGHLLEASDEETAEDNGEEGGAVSEEEMGPEEGNGEEESDDDVDHGELRTKIKTFKDEAGRTERERQKGIEIKGQLALWDSLIECRILMQKVLLKVNQFPQPETWKDFRRVAIGGNGDGDGQAFDEETYKKGLKHCQSKIASVLDDLMAVRRTVLKQSEETRSLLDEDDEEPVRKKLKLAEYSKLLEKNREELLPYRNETIEKWNDKTQLASGQSNQKSFAAFELSTLKQIEHIVSDKSRLVRRTQLRRSIYNVLGQSDRSGDDHEQDPEKDYDEEIFDDDDFYHQLLRDLIEKKTDGADGEALGQKWLQIQKLRSKAKRKVDTRASKGRKIRYDIHSKLVNFMAPVISREGNAISEEAKQELFNSLFKSR